MDRKKLSETLYKYRYIIVMSIFVLCTFVLRINLSSFQSFEMFLPNNISNVSNGQIGSTRGIRSDEWGVLSPIQFSQEYNDYNSTTSFSGEDASVGAISMAIPAKNISAIGKPLTLGFIFGDSIGFSWYHVAKIFCMLIFSYKLLDVLIRNKKGAFAGAFIITLSPGIQWWLTTAACVSEAIIYFEMIVISVYYIFSKKSNKIKNIYTCILLISMVGFTLVLYPAIQVPLVYFGIVLLVGLYLRNKSEIEFNKYNFIRLFIVMGFYLLIIGVTLIQSWADIASILNTVYPGKRVSTGGDLSLDYLANWLPTFLLPFKEVSYSNASEISSFITLFPIPILIYFCQKDKYKDPVIKSLIIFILGALIYMYVGIPKVLAKVTLFSFVTSERMMIVFGLACTILIICMSATSVEKNECRSKKTPIQCFIFLLFVYYIYKNNNEMIQYIGMENYVVLILIIMVLIYCFNYKKKVFLGIFLIMTVLVGGTVNPINFDIEEIKETPISKEIKNINSLDSGMWVTIDDLWLSKYALAQGVPVLNALNYPPMLETWGKIDTEQKYMDVYNRYAHVNVSLDETQAEKFELVQADVFKVYLNYEELKTLGIKYLISKTEISNMSNNIELLYLDQLDGVHIYKLK